MRFFSSPSFFVALAVKSSSNEGGTRAVGRGGSLDSHVALASRPDGLTSPFVKRMGASLTCRQSLFVPALPNLAGPSPRPPSHSVCPATATYRKNLLARGHPSIYPSIRPLVRPSTPSGGTEDATPIQIVRYTRPFHSLGGASM